MTGRSGTMQGVETGSIPYGYCLCGCGRKTKVATKNETAYGAVKGEPRRFVQGHHNRVRELPAAERLWAKVDKDGPGGCWLWTGVPNDSGYGQLHVDGARKMVHRFAYELLVGPIPEGLTLDHLCRVRNCVNPEHLEPVTSAENILRGESGPARNARKTHCARAGHPLAGDNVRITTQGYRMCVACSRDKARARWQQEVANRKPEDELNLFGELMQP